MAPVKGNKLFPDLGLPKNKTPCGLVLVLRPRPRRLLHESSRISGIFSGLPRRASAITEHIVAQLVSPRSVAAALFQARIRRGRSISSHGGDRASEPVTPGHQT
jgi:hypothetical protein